MLVAAIQMTSAAAVADNLADAARLLAEAAAAGARVAVLPENFALMGRREADKLAAAEAPGDGPIQAMLAQTAARLGLWIVAGTVPLRVEGEPRVAAACLVYDEHGKQVARYDKIHLFDVDIPGRDEAYRESANNRPGDVVVVVDTPAGRLGLSVCYDVRFPELFRQMSTAGATWFSVPAAFTVPTGEAHWETLLRARAIENLCGVVAAAQVGQHANGRATYGHSMIIDHWGRVLAARPQQPGVVLADFDPVAQAEARQRFPALAHRRLGC
jgi:predicted amidohydrolase